MFSDTSERRHGQLKGKSCSVATQTPFNDNGRATKSQMLFLGQSVKMKDTYFQSHE